jgi:Pyrimidine reductase, riboflavin biosynthesis
MSDAIRRIWPPSVTGTAPGVVTDAASDDELAEWYSLAEPGERWARVNFVASLDGSATDEGRSAGLGDAADKRVFDVLRRLCDVVVVGAGTVRVEGYGPMRVDEPAAQWRRAHGLAEHPVFAIVSSRLDLDPGSRIFTDAPVRPIVVTSSDAPAHARSALERVADVIICGPGSVDTSTMLDRLAERGLTRVHCEGGPHLFGRMIADGTVDELCLTLSAQLEGGDGPRISTGPTPHTARGMRLAQVLLSGSTLLLRYVRA